MSRPEAPCGTRSAFERHRRRGEHIDDACRKANRAYARQYYAEVGAVAVRERAREQAQQRVWRQEALEALAHRHPEEFSRLLATVQAESLTSAGDEL